MSEREVGMRRLWLWLKYQYYKRIRRLDIVGFYAGITIILSKNLVPESKGDKINKEG